MAVTLLTLDFEFPPYVKSSDAARELVTKLIESSLKKLDKELGERWYHEVRPQISVKTGDPGGELALKFMLKNREHSDRVKEVVTQTWKQLVGG